MSTTKSTLIEPIRAATLKSGGPVAAIATRSLSFPDSSYQETSYHRAGDDDLEFGCMVQLRLLGQRHQGLHVFEFSPK